MAGQDDERWTERHTPASPAPAAREPALPVVGSVVGGKYRVEQTLGSGGMGVVVSAMHLELHQRVALKFVKVTEPDAELIERLRREARITFSLRNQHVARLLDVGTLPSGSPYLVFEHLEGKDLSRSLDERGTLPIAEAIDWVLQACDGLAEAHGLGVVHRDLKPSNLFLTRTADGAPLVKVLDFGVAKALGQHGPDKALTTTEAIVGTPLYMSPEQVRGAKHVDARSDIWALGVILFELLTGETPFGGGAALAVCAAIIADEPKRLRAARPEAPATLERIILRCLEKDPARRFADVGALAAALGAFGPQSSAETLPALPRLVLTAEAQAELSEPGKRVEPATAITAPSNPPRAPARRRWLAVGVVGVCAAAGVFALARVWSSPSTSPAALTAEPRTNDATQAAMTATAPSTTATATTAVKTQPTAPDVAPAEVAVSSRVEPAPERAPVRSTPIAKPAPAPLVRAPIAVTAATAAVTSTVPSPAPAASSVDLEQRATSHRR